MTTAIAKQLREPFKPEEIGKLPKVTCGGCRQSPSKNCQDHRKERCGTCGNWMTCAHIHIDYVGHAELTDRLLQTDPEWNWEPLAHTADGIPFIDTFGGMWIKLTIAGHTRLGYGHADGKKGGDAVKEAIGDALRNAGMRFGIALDLWGAKFEAEASAAISAAAQFDTPPQGTEPDWPQTPTPPAEPMVSQKQHKTMHALWRATGYDGEHNRDLRLEITAKLLRLPSLDTSANLTAVQADHVIAKLQERHTHLKRQQAEQEAHNSREQEASPGPSPQTGPVAS